MRPILYVITFLLCLVTIAQAQRRPEPCATMEMDSLLRLRNPQEGSLDDFERDLQRKMVQIKAKMASGRGTVFVRIPRSSRFQRTLDVIACPIGPIAIYAIYSKFGHSLPLRIKLRQTEFYFNICSA